MTEPAATLPALRQDLELLEAATDIDGAPRWLIYDPLQHKFFAIGRSAHVLLQIWRTDASVEDISAEAWRQFSETLPPADIAEFIGFLQAGRLTLAASGGGWRALAATAEKQRTSWSSHLLHTYLFFRIPLFRPERFLRWTLPRVRPLGTRGFAVFISLTGAAGLYLVSREWDEFRATFAGVATLEGAAMMGIALMLVKLIHEMAHAYVATAYGCRVPVLGVAFILGAPLLYCDVTDAWRLKSRKARFRIDTAGILADLAVACLATLLWAFLPPGIAKHFVFSLATAGWVLSLTMNLNPFMKFDGYHIAGDLLGIENMQDRAMAMGCWRLREILFGLGAPPPEAMRPPVRWALTLYAWSLWLYRLVVFTGIALLVYGFFFKVAGLVLFAVEIGYFVIAPVMREMREWWNMRRAIAASGRIFVSGGLLAAVVGLLAIPLSSSVQIPAVLGAAEVARLYPALPARVGRIHVVHGDSVEAGDRLVGLDSTDLVQALELNRLKTAVISMRLDRGASDTTDKEEAVVLENELSALRQQSEGLIRQRAELDLTAPFAGQVVEMLASLQTGRTLDPREPVLVIRGNGDGQVRGALDERDLWRLREGAEAVFVPDDLNLPRVAVRIESISLSAMAVLDQVELAGNHGGRVAARADARHQPVPVSAQYAIRGRTVAGLPDDFRVRSAAGVVVAEGTAESLMSRAWRQILKVLVRESGF